VKFSVSIKFMWADLPLPDHKHWTPDAPCEASNP